MNRFRIRIAFAGKQIKQNKIKTHAAIKKANREGEGVGEVSWSTRSPADGTHVSAQFPSCSYMAGFGNRLPARLWAIWAMMEIDNWSTRAHDMQSSSAWSLCRRKKKESLQHLCRNKPFCGVLLRGTPLLCAAWSRLTLVTIVLLLLLLATRSLGLLLAHVVQIEPHTVRQDGLVLLVVHLQVVLVVLVPLVRVALDAGFVRVLTLLAVRVDVSVAAAAKKRKSVSTPWLTVSQSLSHLPGDAVDADRFLLERNDATAKNNRRKEERPVKTAYNEVDGTSRSNKQSSMDESDSDSSGSYESSSSSASSSGGKKKSSSKPQTT